jgi:hypothetical protein
MPAIMGEEAEVPPKPVQELGAPLQEAPPFPVSESQMMM